jgi:tetratricopeptide (TPR) repeat protein
VNSKPVFFAFIAALFSVLPLARGTDYLLIIRGKVTMQDGSPPPKAVGIERICSDVYGSAPGPLTNKKGEYLWQMPVDPMRSRACSLVANLAGYVSSQIDISALNAYIKTETELPAIILSPKNPDPYTINDSESDVPGRSRSAWKAAMKAFDANSMAEVENALQEVVQASPKFARGWHTLGLILDNEQKYAPARDAYQHAIEADPKMLFSYVALARVCDRMKDWECAEKASGSLQNVDTKHLYPEIYLYDSIAQFQLKDLDGAKTSAETALEKATQPKEKKRVARAEFVLAKISAAKGDFAATREHLSKFLAEDPNPPDLEQIKAYLQVVGTAEGAGVDPVLFP